MERSTHFSWENPLFLWPFSIAFCMFTRGYLLPVPLGIHVGQLGEFKVSGSIDKLASHLNALQAGTHRLTGHLTMQFTLW